MNNVSRVAVMIVFLSTCALVCVTPMQAQECSAAGLVGKWGFSSTGTLLTPTKTLLYASAGVFTVDAAGAIVGNMTEDINGGFANIPLITGRIVTRADCRTVLILNFTLSSPLVFIRTVRGAVRENQSDIHGVLTEFVEPSTSMPISSVVTFEAERLF
jgi:hypothetical protein